MPDPDSAEMILAAATRIRTAANDIKMASINQKNTLAAHEQFMNSWLRRFQEALTNASAETPKHPIPRFEPSGMDDDIPF